MAAETVLSRATERLARVLGVKPVRWLLVDVSRQMLLLIEATTVTRSYAISTAAAGIDAQQGSGGTPPGVHRIDRKIGAGLPEGTVFDSREPTGEVYDAAGESDDQVDGRQDDERAAENGRDLILTRILTLAGLEAGVNRGGGVDSLARYIYLHGTNQEDRVGQPVSHGCIRLTNRDVVDLFDHVEPGDPVVIL